MIRFALLLLCIVAGVTYAWGQTVKKVTASYTYFAPETMTLEEAKRTALDRAKMQAIANEFGTVVSQTNYTSVSNRNGVSSIDFQSVGYSDLRGEWLETVGEPVYDINYADGMHSISVNVKGKIREITASYAQIQATLLRNVPELRFRSSEFTNRDDLFLHFISPVNGYLSVYLIDDSQTAFCLLPYARQTNGIFTIEANKEYILFSKAATTLPDPTIVDEYIMTCGSSIERNLLAIIFSENPFSKTADFGITQGLPRQLKATDLTSWLSKARGKDLKMQYLEIPFTINP